MTKKTKNEVEETAIPQESFNGDSTAEPQPFSFDADFDVEGEYKEPALIPAGRYEGYVTNVSFDPEAFALVWQVTLRADDDILMSDNETPVNGNILNYKNWFPKDGDETERTRTGRMTKRQAKINMLGDFQKKMRVNMNTPQAILNAVENAEWVGLEVIALVEVRSWEGRQFNQIQELSAM